MVTVAAYRSHKKIMALPRPSAEQRHKAD